MSERRRERDDGGAARLRREADLCHPAMTMVGQARTIDEYLSALSADKRDALQAVRRTVRSVAPAAEECISYGMPAFRLNGMLVGFAAHANHCALYAWNATTIAEFTDELKEFDASKGTVRFTPDKPLPEALVRHLVEAKIVKNAERAKAPRPQRSLISAPMSGSSRRSDRRTRFAPRRARV
jgi:uncharacterized protein YdhG (YjbR/CyaY superfamily)